MEEKVEKENIQILKDTLEIMKKGSYCVNGKIVPLKLDERCQSEAVVLSEGQIRLLKENPSYQKISQTDRIEFSVSNTESFEAARNITQKFQCKTEQENDRVLVLNFANPVHPGGGVRCGAKAQEEDLCRQSTLLASLEGTKARRYYKYHRRQNSDMASDAIILSPHVEILRDSSYQLLEETVLVSVLTCAAPMVSQKIYEVARKETERILYKRIQGMLYVAAAYGYQHLILGAWGCGVFGNDAAVIAEMFKRAFCEMRCKDRKAEELFCSVTFAVLDETMELYNYRCFFNQFSDFYAVQKDSYKETEKAENEKRWMDRFQGCMVGGAVGDALGYPVEFNTAHEIFCRYGKDGITSYEYDRTSGLALISDDTQMSMFTADGILNWAAKADKEKNVSQLPYYIYLSYLDWLSTQMPCEKKRGNSDLLDLPEMYSRRAPGTTCIQALKSKKMGSMEEPINHSKGCGGVMRVAPIGLYFKPKENKIDFVDQIGAAVAAITHGHPLGYMSAAALVHIVNRSVYRTCDYDSGMYGIVRECKEVMEKLFGKNTYLPRLIFVIDQAIEFSNNTKEDLENIRKIGEGWVAEEAFGIALYCSLRYSDDFSKAVTAAVNHDGDSDSTGAITGNIVGAYLGYDRIPSKWKKNLEFQKIILKLTEQLYHV